MHVRFLDLSIKDEDERSAVVSAVERILDHGQVVLGPEVFEFERLVANHCGRKHAIGVGSGTDSLILGLKALGIGKGDEVITTPLSWLATGSAILLNGAKAVFCDIDDTLNMDPTTIESLITPRTKAILPVHFTGRLARMPEIRKLAQQHKLMTVEDGSQAFGATLNGKPCGSFGEVACISFNAMKPLGGLGDAGIVLCDDDELAKRVRLLRHSGVPDRDYCETLSHNCRLDTLQAAILINRLARYPKVINRRRAIAKRYNLELNGIVKTPPVIPGYDDIFYTYTIRTNRRDELRNYLTERGIENRIQHPILMNDQPAFQGMVTGTSPRAEKIIREILSIPVHEKISGEDQTYVIKTIKQFFLGSA